MSFYLARRSGQSAHPAQPAVIRGDEMSRMSPLVRADNAAKTSPQQLSILTPVDGASRKRRLTVAGSNECSNKRKRTCLSPSSVAFCRTNSPLVSAALRAPLSMLDTNNSEDDCSPAANPLQLFRLDVLEPDCALGQCRGEAAVVGEEEEEEEEDCSSSSDSDDGDICWRRARLRRRVSKQAPSSAAHTGRRDPRLRSFLSQDGVSEDLGATTLGRGNYGTVYSGQLRSTGSPVAVKVLRCDDTVCMQRELQFAKSLEHPNIVKVLDSLSFDEPVDRADGKAVGGVIVMEQAEFCLADGLKADAGVAPYDPADVKQWMRQLLSALDYLHTTKRMLHRDIKPANLLVDSDGNLRLCDFSISRQLDAPPAAAAADAAADAAAASDTAETLANDLTRHMSTPLYAAPEMLLEMMDRCGHAVDMWACGLVLAELLTGQRLMQSAGSAEQLQLAADLVGPLSPQQQAAAKVAGFELNQPASAEGLTERLRAELSSAAVSAECFDLIRQMLQPRPEDRPTAARALAHPYFCGAQ